MPKLLRGLDRGVIAASNLARDFRYTTLNAVMISVRSDMLAGMVSIHEHTTNEDEAGDYL